MRAVLDALPPKLVRVSSHAPPTPIVLRESEGGEHIEAAVQRILHGTFTGSGDKPKVVNLYKTYVGHIVRALQETLAFAASDAEKEGLLQVAGDDADELPAMGVPPAPLLKCAPVDQPVAFLANASLTDASLTDASVDRACGRQAGREPRLACVRGWAGQGLRR